MDDDFSIESIYEKGLGISVDGIFQNTELSVEDYDNSVAYEIAGMKSLIDSMELYMNMTELNKAQKIQMAHRINANYGYYNRSLENYCERLIHSTEDEENKEDDSPKEEKKQNIFQKFFHLIGNFLKTIFKKIRRIWTIIIDKLCDSLGHNGVKAKKKKAIEEAKKFNKELNTIQPYHEKFTNLMEKIYSSKSSAVNDKEKSFYEIFKWQCKIISKFYDLLFKSSKKIIDYINSYYEDKREMMLDTGDINQPTLYIKFDSVTFINVLTSMTRTMERKISGDDRINECVYDATEKIFKLLYDYHKDIYDHIDKVATLDRYSIDKIGNVIEANKKAYEALQKYSEDDFMKTTFRIV